MTDQQALLFEDVRVLTADKSGLNVELLSHQYVLVSGERFAYVGPSKEEALRKLSSYQQDNSQHDLKIRNYAGQDRLLLPGFANAHAHLAMTLLRNAADDKSLHDWLFNEIFPKEDRLREEDVACGSELGILELLQSGTTASADMYFFPHVTAELALKKGFRLNFSIGAIDLTADSYKMRDFKQVQELVERYHGAGNGLLRSSLLVHSPYLYPEAAYADLAEYANRLDIAVQVHLAETRQEVEDTIAKYGQRPTQFLFARGFFKQPTMAAHAIHLDETELEILKNSPTYLVHNPASNMKLASGIMPAQRYLDYGLKLALGTDGPSSSNKLDFYSDLRLAALLGKLPDLNPIALRAADAFLMATSWGYAALGYPDGGTVREGALADFQVLNFRNSPGFWPEHNLLSAIVYSADRSAIESVGVAGKLLIDHGEAISFDLEKLRAQVQSSAEYLCQK